MKRLILLTAVLMLAAWMAGCGSPMRKVPVASLDDPLGQNESAIVFFLNKPDGMVRVPVVEVLPGDKYRLVSVMPNRSRYLHKTTPGKHLYLIDGPLGFFLEANIEGGKFYYVSIAEIRPNQLKMYPMTKGEVQSEVYGRTTWYENTKKSQDWFAENEARIERRYENLLRHRERGSLGPGRVEILPPGYGTTSLMR